MVDSRTATRVWKATSSALGASVMCGTWCRPLKTQQALVASKAGSGQAAEYTRLRFAIVATDRMHISTKAWSNPGPIVPEQRHCSSTQLSGFDATSQTWSYSSLSCMSVSKSKTLFGALV